MAYKFTKEDVLYAIEGSQGIISKVQKKLENKAQHKIGWHTADRLINRWEETKQAIKNEVNFIADVCEQEIYKSIVAGDMSTIKWYATLKMKDRGYDPVPTLKLEGSDPLNINFNGMTKEDLENADNVTVHKGAADETTGE